MQAIGRAWSAVLGPSGWRSLIGPLTFALVSIALLIYDHLNQRVPALVFWLTLGLIVTVFARMLETSRRQSGELARRRRDAVNDQITGLRNRASLETDIEAAAAAPGDGWVLVLLELEGLEAHSDRRGYSAGDEVLRHAALGLVDAVLPLGGIAYRVGASRLAVLVPITDRQIGEVVLAATGPQAEELEALTGRSYGEVTIPGEASDADTAFQVAGRRLAAHRRRRHRSARRQAHAVLMAALDARRPEARNRLRVSAYRAIPLARRLGLEREEIDDIALAAELQPVGLLAVPDAVLDKEEALDEAERALVRSHTAEGARIVSAAPGLATVARLVRSSAEHFDGSGYPDGLAGESIPIGARVIAVAVAFAAMTEPRAQRRPLSPSEALAELRRSSGSQFDPRVVEALAADLAEESAPAVPA